MVNLQPLQPSIDLWIYTCVCACACACVCVCANDVSYYSDSLPCPMVLFSVPGKGLGSGAVAHSSSTLQVNFPLVMTPSLSKFCMRGCSWSLGRYYTRKIISLNIIVCNTRICNIIQGCFVYIGLLNVIKYISLYTYCITPVLVTSKTNT